MSLEVAMQWNSSFNESVHTFANTINTHEGGTHEEGFRAALTNTVNKWGETWGMIKKKDDRVSGDDIREGLTAIISVKLAEPQFEGQTKTKLGNTEARSFVQKVRQRPARRLVREEPGRGQGHRPQDASRPRAPGWPRARPATCRAAARACSTDEPARQAERLPSTEPRVRGVHRRGRLAPAAPRRADATPAPRRSCRSAARS